MQGLQRHIRDFAASFANAGADGRVAAVDCAKGISIILIVMMHATIGVGEALGGEGFLHTVIAFAQPLRIPAFFLIAGLFLARGIAQPWARYLDGKVLHFVWLYLLWLVIQLSFKGGVAGQGAENLVDRFLMALVEPMGTLWFIYMLPVFYIAAKLLRRVNPVLVLAVSAWMNIVPGETGWLAPDEFAERFVYFYAGYLSGARLLALTGSFARSPRGASAALAIWAGLNGAILALVAAAGLTVHQLPGLPLALGLAGALAILTLAGLLARVRAAAFLGFIGRNSLVVYLTFFLPMATARIAIQKLTPGIDIGLASLMVTGVSVAVPLLLVPFSQKQLSWLFRRPGWLIKDQIDIEMAYEGAKPSPRPAMATHIAAQSPSS